MDAEELSKTEIDSQQTGRIVLPSTPALGFRSNWRRHLRSKVSRDGVAAKPEEFQVVVPSTSEFLPQKTGRGCRTGDCRTRRLSRESLNRHEQEQGYKSMLGDWRDRLSLPGNPTAGDVGQQNNGYGENSPVETKHPKRLDTVASTACPPSDPDVTDLISALFKPGPASNKLNAIFQDAARYLDVRMPKAMSRYEGEYGLLEGFMANDYPVWRQYNGEHWLFSSVDGMLLIGGSEEAAVNFQCREAEIASTDIHAGKLPYEMMAWQWDDGENWIKDSSISVQVAKSAYGARDVSEKNRCQDPKGQDQEDSDESSESDNSEWDYCENDGAKTNTHRVYTMVLLPTPGEFMHPNAKRTKTWS